MSSSASTAASTIVAGRGQAGHPGPRGRRLASFRSPSRHARPPPVHRPIGACQESSGQPAASETGTRFNNTSCTGREHSTSGAPPHWRSSLALAISLRPSANAVKRGDRRDGLLFPSDRTTPQIEPGVALAHRARYSAFARFSTAGFPLYANSASRCHRQAWAAQAGIDRNGY
jgi:hypothetical protein